MASWGKKVQKSDGDKLELGDLPSVEPTPSSSKWLLKQIGAKRNESESEKKSPKGQKEAGFLQGYRHVPPDPPAPVFVEMEYGSKFSKANLKRSQSFSEKSSTSEEDAATSGKLEPQPSSSKKGTMEQRSTALLTFPEVVKVNRIVVATATAMKGNVRRTSAFGDVIASELRRKPKLRPNNAIQQPEHEDKTKMHEEREQGVEASIDAVPETDADNKEIDMNNVRICHFCNGVGKLPTAENLEKNIKKEKQKKEKGERKFPDPRQPPERRHSTGNQDHNSALMTDMIRRADPNQLESPMQSTAVKCVQYFLAFLYYVGMSPIKPASAKQLPKWFQIIQLTFFTLFSTISILQALADVKLVWIQFCEKGNFMSFVTLGFFFGDWLARIYNIHTLVSSAKETAILLEKIDAVNALGASNNSGGQARAFAIGLGTISMLLVGFDVTFGDIPFNTWVPQDVILGQSMDMSQIFFIWSPTNLTDTLEKLIDDYGLELTTTTWALGLFGGFVNYCGVLHGCMMLDLWPIIALQIILLHSHFSGKMEETKKLTKEERNGRCPLSIHWQYYMAFRDVCDQSHCVFGKFLKIIHLQNILQFGHFLAQILKFKGIRASLLVNAVSVFKVGLTYYIVQKSADKNEEYEDCVIQCAERRPTIEMGGIEVSVTVLITDMRKHPLGIGRGDFVVNEGFVLKIACFVGSLFALLADDFDKKDGQN